MTSDNKVNIVQQLRLQADNEANTETDSVTEDDGEDDRDLVTCDLCFHVAETRPVSITCCPSLVCRSCGVRYITRHQQCWMCYTRRVTDDLEINKDWRKYVSLYLDKKFQGFSKEVREELMERRLKVEDWRKKRKEKLEKEDSEDYLRNDFIFSNERKPRSDLERLMLSKKYFKNPESSQPDRSLSFHGFRRYGGSKQLRYSSRTLPLKSRSFKLVNGQIKPRSDYVKTLLGGGKTENESKDEVMISQYKIPMNVRPAMIQSYQSIYKGRYSSGYDKEGLRMMIKHYTESVMETFDFASLVTNNNTDVTSDRLEEIVETERHMGDYSHHYGAMEKQDCKQCNARHW